MLDAAQQRTVAHSNAQKRTVGHAVRERAPPKEQSTKSNYPHVAYTCLGHFVLGVDLFGHNLQGPRYVGDVVDVAIHVHVAVAGHLLRALNLQRRGVWLEK